WCCQEFLLTSRRLFRADWLEWYQSEAHRLLRVLSSGVRARPFSLPAAGSRAPARATLFLSGRCRCTSSEGRRVLSWQRSRILGAAPEACPTTGSARLCRRRI